MSSDLDTLLEMGFDKSRAELAVKKGSCKPNMRQAERIYEYSTNPIYSRSGYELVGEDPGHPHR